MEGIKTYDLKWQDFLVVTFDDEKVSLEDIIRELKKENFKVKGEPVYLESK